MELLAPGVGLKAILLASSENNSAWRRDWRISAATKTATPAAAARTR
ncbi:MAG: hypothetical protein R2748_13695 [Bryobacterales bacterium]